MLRRDSSSRIFIDANSIFSEECKVPLIDLNHENCMNLLSQDLKLKQILDFSLLKKLNITGKDLDELTTANLISKWQVNSLENRKHITDYIMKHVPNATILNYEEVLLKDMTHEQTLQFLLQHP